MGDLRAALAVLGALPPGRFCAADTAYDSNGLRQFLIERGTLPVIPNNPTRRRPYPFDPALYRTRNLIERMFCRLKDFRRSPRATTNSPLPSKPPSFSPPSSLAGPERVPPTLAFAAVVINAETWPSPPAITVGGARSLCFTPLRQCEVGHGHVW